MELIGFAAATVLLLTARALLPREARPRANIAFVYLVFAAFAGLGLYLAEGSAERVLLFFYCFFVLASIGRSLVLLAVDVVFGRRIHRAPPRIFRDLTQAVVYVAVLLLTLRAIGVEPGSLLTTSALLTAVIGLALQDTLGNLVSGLALQMQRPFEVGDWIQFESDAKQIGRVTEVNWRATTVMTNDLVELIVPNATLAKSIIRNFSRPSPLSRRTVTVQSDYKHSPQRVREVILAGVQDCPGVLGDPPPQVLLGNFAESGIEYQVRYFTTEFANRDRMDASVRDRIWYAFHRAGVGIPFPVRTVHMHTVSDASQQREQERELQRRDDILRVVDFLDVLTPEAHKRLASAASVRLYAPGEIVFRQGDPSSELFIVDRGEVAIEHSTEEGGAPVVVSKLGSGKFFGEMGLLTGEKRAASVRATTECECLVIGHAAFDETLRQSADLVDKMSELLAARQAELDAAATERQNDTIPMHDRSRRLISQIKDFFKL